MNIKIIRTLIIVGLLLSFASKINLEPLITTPSRSLAYDSNLSVQSEPQSKISYIKHTPKMEINSSLAADSAPSYFFPFIPYYRKLPDLRSPFSLQIAALNQVLPDPTAQENGSSVKYQSLGSALKDSGADWLRVRVEWETIEPNEPLPGEQQEYFWQYHDEALRLVAETGVRIIATLSDSPSWAASVPCAPIYSDRLDEFARFLTDLVNRYKVPPYQIKHWELVNEPDSNRYTYGHISGHGCWAYDGDQYAKMLKVANQAIKKADPHAAVLMGGIAYDWFEEYGGPFNRYFPDDVMENGGGFSIDALNLHYYPDFSAEWDRWNPESDDRQYAWIPAPTCGIVDDGVGNSYDVEGFDIVAKTTHYRNRMNTCYGVAKPVWVTEVGAHGYPDDQASLDNQARYVVKVYARALSAGVQNITWFSLDRPPYDRFGQSLLNSDYSPKPAYFAYQTLTSELDGFYEYSRNRNSCVWGSSGVSCDVEAYIFKNDGQDVKTVAWGSRTLKFSASKLRVVNRNGIESTIKDGGRGDVDRTVNGIVKLQLSDEPVFISKR